MSTCGGSSENCKVHPPFVETSRNDVSLAKSRNLVRLEVLGDNLCQDDIDEVIGSLFPSIDIASLQFLFLRQLLSQSLRLFRFRFFLIVDPLYELTEL